MEKVTAESKKQIFAEHGSSEKDSGSVASQVALFTARIKYLTEHVKKNKKDGTLTIVKRNTKVACATDETITAATPVTVSFSSASAKAVKQFGILSTIFSLSVASE